jgi:GNAT superfamily N-acetyltransferase
MIEYQRVPLDRVIDLRHDILRAGLPRQTAIFDGDDETDTAHFAAIDDGRVVGCVTIMRRPYSDHDAWQLRGMAVNADVRGQGVGAMLLTVAEAHARQAGGPVLLWCNAREPAVGFYQHHGWQLASERFDIPTAGPHFRMTKPVDAAAAHP